MRTFTALAFCVLLTLACSAEPRWCVVSSKDPSNTLLYPPIARAARVQGVVVLRMIYQPNGKVERTEPVFGPVLLAESVTKQLLNWTVKTEAIGEEQCVTLIIADFRIHDADGSSQLLPAPPTGPGILGMSVDTDALVISDPAGTLTIRNRIQSQETGGALIPLLRRVIGLSPRKQKFRLKALRKATGVIHFGGARPGL